ncbi:MAG: carboxypeptidase regulatory-like domain-containing protein [Prevotella sp.]
MKKIVLDLAAMLLCVVQAAAQTGGTVTGVLKEKTSDLPMEFATVVLHEAGTKSVVNGCMTDSTGQFRFEKVPAGTYYVDGSYVGCTPVRPNVFILEKGQTIDIGTLYISEGEQLAEVVVEGRKPTLITDIG